MQPEPPARFDPIWDALAEPDPARYPTTHGSRYLLPCHLLTHGGLYEYVLVDVAQARQWLLAGPCQSFVQHPFLHEMLLHVIGFMVPVPQKGPFPALSYADDALIFTLETYEYPGAMWTGNSQRMRKMIDEERYALGLLRRLS